MDYTNTQTTQFFTELVQDSLRLGVKMATDAVIRRDVGFFEDAIKDQAQLRALTHSNRANHVSFDEWVVNAKTINASALIHKYDPDGELNRLTETLFTEYAQAYYDQFVVPAFEVTEEAIDQAFDTQVASLKATIEMINSGVLGDDADSYFAQLQVDINKKIGETTPEQLIDVLKSSL